MEHSAAVRRLVVVGGEVSRWGRGGLATAGSPELRAARGEGGLATAQRRETARRRTGGRGRGGEDMDKPAGTSWRSRARHGRNWRVPDNLLLQTQNYLYYGVHKINTNTTKQESIKEEILYRIRFLEN